MDYKATLHLPRTDFPMRASLPQREPEFLRRWDAADLYGQLRARGQGRPRWILHDGPPYANGHIHMGTALNKVLKDIVVKSRAMLAHDAVYVPGWDCHGLPIEHQVDKELGLDKAGSDVRTAMDPIEKRRRCRAYALRFIEIQRAEFRRLGIFGDWGRPYLTMAPAYQAVIAREFGRFVGRGLVYKGLKPVHWCMHCKTALAQAEVEYEDQETPSVYVKFPLVTPLPGLPTVVRPSIVIWTTTPWTLPANLAVAVNPSEKYVALDVDGETLVVAASLAEAFTRVARLKSPRRLATLEGVELVGLEYRHPWIERAGRIAGAPFVAMDTGTGLVHIAPGHGEEDWKAGLTYRLPVLAPVDSRGRFTPEVPEFAGQFVFKADPGIIELLKTRHALLHAGTTEHSYPHCWRCKKPVIFRATEQWFMSLEHKALKLRAAKAARTVHWHPAAGAERMGGMIDLRPDWCISRQRVWGVPIPVMYCAACNHPHATEASVAAIRDWVAEESADTWWVRGPETLLPTGTRCESCGGQTFRKETDTLDVWFDSGMTHTTVLKASEDLTYPADLYLEGHDQFRGWFQSSLLTATALSDTAPYRDVLVNGFVLDPEGDKMSKSLGNVVTLMDAVNRWGADVMRWWTLSEEFTQDMRLSAEGMDRVQDAYRKIRNTLRYLLGNLADWNGKSGAQGHAIDDWMRGRLHATVAEVTAEMDGYRFHRAAGTLVRFCTVDLSAIYLDVLKDRMYASKADDPGRTAAQDVLAETADALVRMLAPFLPFTAEDAWQHLPEALKSGKASVHLADWPALHDPDPAAATQWATFLRLRDAVMKSLETARQSNVIDQPLTAKVTVAGAGAWPAFLEPLAGSLPELLVVSQAGLAKSGSGTPSAETSEGALWVTVTKADGAKCDRCWLVKEDTGKKAPGLCDRCADAVGKPA
jgi:isoleucyl-tRNA synthetase